MAVSARQLDPGEFLVVFASGKDRQMGTGELHTNFKLSATGEYVALVAPGGVVVSEFGPGDSNYPAQVSDVSYGMTPEGSRYFMAPTPGAPNGVGQTGFVSELQVSVERGFYETPFTVEISTDTLAATILYTTDGRVPTADRGAVYSEPIMIAGTTTLRAVALKQDLIPTAVQTHTYLFPADVLRQDGSQLETAPWGNSVQGVPQPDWDVDPKIVYYPDPESRLTTDDLLTIPTVSLVMDFEDMFGRVNPDGTYENGIYNLGQNEEKATSVELINSDGSTAFQIDGSVQIVGGTSPNRWYTRKLSMRLRFDNEFGSGDLEYPVYGAGAATSFDTLVLDAHYNFTWTIGQYLYQMNQAQYLRDQYAADMQLAVGGYGPHDYHVHLYIDGIYWGLYRLHERPDDNFAAAYFGGENEDYDVIKHNPRDLDFIVQGSNENYFKLLDVTREDLSKPDSYQAVADRLDIDDFIRYMLINFYGGNTDWGGHNWYATYNRVEPNGRWRFHSWDAEYVLQDVSHNVTGKNVTDDPTEIHQNLMASPEYRLRFADLVHQYLFNDGVLTPTRAAELYQVRLDQIDRAVVAESARWGDTNRLIPYTRGLEWVRERDRLLTEYFPQRTDVVLNQLRSAGLYPALAAPELSQHGGPVYPSSDLSLTAPEGTIYFTTDGTDPRLAGGDLAPGAQPLTGPFQLAQNSTVKARVLKGDQWSALTEAAFEVISELPLRITELNYQPHNANLGLGELPRDNDLFEFVELANVGPQPINLDGVRLAVTAADAGARQGITFTFAPQMLPAGAALVVVRDRSAFESRYGADVPIAAGNGGTGGTDGQYHGSLSNDGQQITLLDAYGAVIHQFAYRTQAPWPARSQGYGSSLEVIDPTGDYGASTNWRASNQYGGSPGQAGSGPWSDVIINEVVRRAAGAEPDQIELYNTTATTVDISGWYLSDDETDRLKAQIPAGTTIAAGQYVTVDLAALGIDLDGSQAGALWLLAADGAGRPVRFVDEVSWEATDAGVPLGRWPNGDPAGHLLPLANPSLGVANGPLRPAAVVISEVHYRHPPLAPLLVEDFADGMADGFTPVRGIWEVRDGGYEVTPDPNAETSDTIATISTAGPLPMGLVLSATITTRTLADFQQNAALIFDYHSPTDFKFVSMHPGGGKWRIGQRDATGWKFLDEQEVRWRGILLDNSVDKDLFDWEVLEVRVMIQGSSVTLWHKGVFFSYQFDTNLSDGQLGFGSKGGAPRFDNVKLEWLGDPQDLEFVELVGTADGPIDLGGWRLEGAVELSFPPGMQIEAGAALVAVDFDSNDPDQALFFRVAHGIDESVALIGPYGSNLHDEGGAIRLLKPVTADDGAIGFMPVDQVQYARQSPWPSAADGQGGALSRAAVTAPGQLPASWSALPPTPGTVEFATPGDLNFDGTVDGADVGGFAQVVADPAAYQAAYGVPVTLVADVDGDQKVDFDDIDDFVALLTGSANGQAAARLEQVQFAPTRAASLAVTGRRSAHLAPLPQRQPAPAPLRARDPDHTATPRRTIERHRPDRQPPQTRQHDRGGQIKTGLAAHRARQIELDWENLADRAMETAWVWWNRIR